jgi:hypothetical protein
MTNMEMRELEGRVSALEEFLYVRMEETKDENQILVNREAVYLKQVQKLIHKYRRLQHSYALQLIDDWRWAMNEGSRDDFESFLDGLPQQPSDTTIFELAEKFQAHVVGLCEVCGTRAPLRDGLDPHGSNKSVRLCAWDTGCETGE